MPGDQIREAAGVLGARVQRRHVLEFLAARAQEARRDDANQLTTSTHRFSNDDTRSGSRRFNCNAYLEDRSTSCESTLDNARRREC